MRESGAPNPKSGAPTSALPEQSHDIPVERYSAELIDEIAEGFRRSRLISWWALFLTWGGLFALALPHGAEALILGAGIMGGILAMLAKSMVRNIAQGYHLWRLEEYGVDKKTRRALTKLADYGHALSKDEIAAVLRGAKLADFGHHI